MPGQHMHSMLHAYARSCSAPTKASPGGPSQKHQAGAASYVEGLLPVPDAHNIAFIQRHIGRYSNLPFLTDRWARIADKLGLSQATTCGMASSEVRCRRLTGKVAVVTAATAGIGLGEPRCLAAKFHM